jgi:hypothetical protein
MHEKKRQRIEGTHTEGADEIVKAITEVLQQASGKEIERIAKEVGLTGITYSGDSMFQVEEK